MTIDTVLQTEIDRGERQVLDEDRERWKRMGAGAHLDEWLAYGPGLMIRRRLAMRLAFTNRPEGKGYAQAFAELMEHDGLHTMDKTSVSCVLWFFDDPGRQIMLRELREGMTPGMRSRLNSPISARQRVEKLLKARDGGTEAAIKTSPVARLTQTIAEQERELARLRARLAKAEDGSLFDIKQSTAKEVAPVLASHWSESKWREVKGETDAIYKRKRQKPAG